MFTRIIVPLDGSPVAEIALPYARGLAQGLGVPVTLLSVIDPEEISRQIATERGLFLDTLDDFASRRRDEYLNALVQSFVGVPVTARIEHGAAAGAIIHFARTKPDRLIALCSHGRSGARRWALGSVSENVVRHASNPVLILRAAD